MKTKGQQKYELAEPFAKENLKKIEVVTGDYTPGQKCQHVVRHRMKPIGSDTLVVALVFIPRSGVIIHFVNGSGVEGKKTYTDNTLGYLSSYNTYYKIAEFTLEDLADYDHPAGMDYLLAEMEANINEAIGYKN